MTLNEHIRRMKWQSVSVFVFYGTFTGRFSPFLRSYRLQIVVVCLEIKLFEIFIIIIINQMSQFASIPVTFSHGIFINS